VIIERQKFGPKGWNRSYPFGTGDLINSAMILSNYLEGGSDKVPWNDLKYMFGEILYGGHITDDLDRLLCNTYLDYYMRDELMDEMDMFPFNTASPDDKFLSPPVLSFDDYFTYIDQELPSETPVAYGLHPNAEISVKTTQAETLFSVVLELQPRGAAAAGDSAQSEQNRVQSMVTSIVDSVKHVNYNLNDIAQQIMEDRGPYQNVFMQECERMNNLTAEMRRSLLELELGISGELQMSTKMEDLQRALFLGRVPASWARLAYPSKAALGLWCDNLLMREAQLSNWVEDPSGIPKVTNIAYFFNPQSFLTAIMQKTAQKNGLELDKLVIETNVTRKTYEQTDSAARDGAYVCGMHLEGARWNWNLGQIEECLPREMSFAMPVITCHAVMAERLEKSGVYRCPVYKTQDRGPTFVFTANLRSKLPSAKWVLAGVVMVLEVVA
jgi:dynein heavy chain